MKSHRYFLISLLTLFSFNTGFACWEYWYSPNAYYMYRVHSEPANLAGEFDDYHPNVKQNCEAWQNLTSDSIPIDDIHQVVYKLTLKEFEAIYNNRLISYENKFSEWITKKDTTVLDFLLLAKTNEYIRVKHNSRWYYPSMKIDARMTLEEVAEKALANKDIRLRDRYLLQGVRALFSLAKYDECIALWEKEISFLPDNNLMRQLILPYIAGAEFHTKHSKKAIKYFAELGDVKSMLFCAGRNGEKLSPIEALELVCEHAPNSKYIEQTLQTYVRSIEPEGCFVTENNFEITSDFKKLYALSLKMAREGKCKNPALWYYTAAFLKDLSGDVAKASHLLNLAEQSSSTSFIDESIRVFRAYLDAKLLPYNSYYEKKLFRQLRWFDSKIKDNIDANVVHEIATGYKLMKGKSFYYWNDMMRRILLGVVCPKMIKAGKTVRALQLANMADNRLLMLINKHEIREWIEKDSCYSAKTVTMRDYRYSSDFNNYDYCNHFFEIIDSVGINSALKYVQCIKQPKSEFDRFLNNRGYIETDYLNDIIGTQYLRVMKYNDAMKYLGAVSVAFKKHLNVSLHYDPFSLARKKIEKMPDFKYIFAKEMSSLEQSINITNEPNRKALLILKYATGIKNSFDRCWALTQYYRGLNYWGQVSNKRDWENDKYTTTATKKVKKLIKHACEIVTDEEIGANIQYLLCNFKTVARDYPNTEKGMLVKGTCDNLCDYHAESQKSLSFFYQGL